MGSPVDERLTRSVGASRGGARIGRIARIRQKTRVTRSARDAPGGRSAARARAPGSALTRSGGWLLGAAVVQSTRGSERVRQRQQCPTPHGC